MDGRFDYRQHLLEAVRILLEQKEQYAVNARRVVNACPSPKAFTVDSVVWGGILSHLGDPFFDDDTSDELQELHRFLSGQSHAIMRGYLCYDFRPHMSEQARVCADLSRDMVAFLEQFPFASGDQAIAEYEQRRDDLQRALAALGPAEYMGEELVYHLALREVGTALGTIAMEVSLHSTKYLTPMPPYALIAVPRVPPTLANVTGMLPWAQRVLSAIAGDDWLAMSWQINGSFLLFSLH